MKLDYSNDQYMALAKGEDRLTALVADGPMEFPTGGSHQ